MIKRFTVLTFAAACLLFSCNGDAPGSGNDTVDSATGGTPAQAPAQPTIGANQVIVVNTFEIIDSIGGKSKGWGYDLVVDGKRVVRQPIIPSIAGNNAFRTEAEARKVGELAAARMRRTGSLPAIEPKDLDSLGITY